MRKQSLLIVVISALASTVLFTSLIAQEKTDQKPPEPTININLTVSEANFILTKLADLPFKESAPLILKINQQAEQQLRAKPDSVKKK